MSYPKGLEDGIRQPLPESQARDQRNGVRRALADVVTREHAERLGAYWEAKLRRMVARGILEEVERAERVLARLAPARMGCAQALSTEGDARGED